MISKRRYMRDVTEARRTYRQATEELEAKLLAKERELDALLDTLYRARVTRQFVAAGGHFGPRIIIDVQEMIGALPDNPQWLWERLSRRIIDALLGARKDYRPDMREAATREDGVIDGLLERS